MGKCFDVTEADGMVRIVSDYQNPQDDPETNYAIDTMDAWIVLRDEIKAGKWDHIGTGA